MFAKNLTVKSVMMNVGNVGVVLSDLILVYRTVQVYALVEPRLIVMEFVEEMQNLMYAVFVQVQDIRRAPATVLGVR